MAARERWLRIIVGLGVFALAGAAFLFLFLLPYFSLCHDEDTAQDELAKKNKEEADFFKGMEKMNAYRLAGVPSSVNQGETEYAEYLKTLLVESGHKLAVTTVSPMGDAKIMAVPTYLAQTSAGGKKLQPTHLVRSFQVRSESTWPKLVSFLEKFQRTSFLHRIKTFNIERTSGEGSPLSVAMTIETLSVNPQEKGKAGAKTPSKIAGKPRPDNLWGIEKILTLQDAVSGLTQSPAGWSMLLRAQLLLPSKLDHAEYAEMSRKNPFLGKIGEPPPKPIEIVKKDPEKEKSKNPDGKVDVLQFVSIMETQSEKNKAVLRNQLIPIASKEAYTPLATSEEFRIFDDNRKVVLKGTVLRIDQHDVYFQVDSKIYRIHTDYATLADAMRRPLSDSEVKALDLKLQNNPLEKGGKSGKINPDDLDGFGE